MDALTAIQRAKKHLREITSGDWKIDRFDVKTVANQHVCKAIRASDAEFIADAPAVMASLVRHIDELVAKNKAEKAAGAVEANRVTTLTDKLDGMTRQRDEMKAQRDALQAELDARAAARR